MAAFIRSKEKPLARVAYGLLAAERLQTATVNTVLNSPVEGREVESYTSDRKHMCCQHAN